LDKTLLNYPIYFVTPRFEEFRELEECEALPKNLDSYFVKLLSGHDIWTTQTFLFLKKSGLPVHLSPHVVPGEICVLDYYQFNLSSIPKLLQSYIIGIRTDTPKPYLCNETIVINRRVSENGKHHYVDHWPQPIMVKRDKTRNAKIENIEFKGRKTNLWPPLQKESFISELRGLKANYVVTTEDEIVDEEKLYRQWGDYRTCDILVALRNMTEYDANLKPALKLINAWHAGVPALLGPEPAYQALRKSEYDYIEIKSSKDIISAIEFLKENPEFYLKMIENGKKRAEAFSIEKIVDQWENILRSSVYSGYEKWKQRNVLERTVDSLTYCINGIRHKLARKEYVRLIQEAPRILD